MEKEIYYHGSSQLFYQFDSSHAFEGDGKTKFGFGTYVSPVYASAALYAGKSHHTGLYYVYTVKSPEKKADNFLPLHKPVAASIVAKAAEKLGKDTPEEYLENGKFFRKYIALSLAGKIPPKAKNAKTENNDEKAASAFLLSIGVEFIEWPYDWGKPDGEMNLAILDEKAIKILKIEEIELECKRGKNVLVEGSQKTIFEV